MIETHPFGIFVPPAPRFLILGSFPGRQALKGTSATDDSCDWFYGTKRNQFWPILEEVYGLELDGRAKRQELLTRLGIAMADIIYQCERRAGNNLDSNLTVITYNTGAIEELLSQHAIREVLFSSRFVEKTFKKLFGDIPNKCQSMRMFTLPSPSPRYAQMSRQDKVRKYRELLPNLPVNSK
jgi:hypoxanthine-DNA glycosylase